MVLLFSSVVHSEPFPLVTEGKPACTIVIAEPAPSWTKTAVREIQDHVKQITGVELPVVKDSDALPDHALLVGSSKQVDALRVTLDAKALGPEGFILKSTGPHLVAAGVGPRGTIYACESLIEKLGVRWFTPTVTRAPKQQTLALPELNETQTPAFEYREPYFTEAFNTNWARRLKMNGASMPLDEANGGNVAYFHFVHTLDDLIPRDLYTTHPEYFPLIKGERKNGYVQRCLSNPDVLKLSIEKVRQWIKERPDAMIYSVSQNDTANWCQCDRCTEIASKYGGQSGLYLWFVNQVAEAIEKDHPDKLIDTLAYQFTEAPPAGIIPRKNVRVRLCPIYACCAHPYEKCSAKPTVDFLQHLRGWGAITDTLYIWHYNTDFANYLMPFPDFEEFPAEIHLYRKSGVKGIFFEGDAAPGGGGSDAELRSYVMAKLLWNPDLDSDALVTEWMKGVYGPAWDPMRKWFDLLHEKARDPEHHFFCFEPVTAHYLSPDVIEAVDKLFDEAQKLAAEDAVAKDYVSKSRLWLRYVKIVRHPAAGPELDQFLADIRARGIHNFREHQPIDVWEKEFRAKIPK